MGGPAHINPGGGAGGQFWVPVGFDAGIFFSNMAGLRSLATSGGGPENRTLTRGVSKMPHGPQGATMLKKNLVPVLLPGGWTGCSGSGHANLRQATSLVKSNKNVAKAYPRGDNLTAQNVTRHTPVPGESKIHHQNAGDRHGHHTMICRPNPI